MERYAYFFPPALPPVDGSNNITNIGKAYRDFNASTPAITQNIDNTELLTDHLDKKLEAETAATRLGSTVSNCAAASGGQMATAVSGSTNRIAFHNVVMPQTGNYNMIVSYFSNVGRNLTLRINHGPSQVFGIPASGLWCFEGGTPGSVTIPLSLLSGTNTIEFTDCPIIDYIEVKPMNILPVSLLDLKGRVLAKSIELTWKTSQESNSRYFEIMKSAEGMQFSPAGRVRAAGNSNAPVDYLFTDNNPLPGINFYKLKAVDADGSFRYSKSIAVKFENGTTGLKLVSANSTSITVSAHSNTREQASIRLLGMDGKILYSQKVLLNEGNNYIQVPASMPKGTMAVISLHTGSNLNSIKIIR